MPDCCIVRCDDLPKVKRDHEGTELLSHSVYCADKTKVTTYQEAAVWAAETLMKEPRGDGACLGFYHAFDIDGGCVDITSSWEDDEAGVEEDADPDVRTFTKEEVEMVSPVAGLLLKLPVNWAKKLLFFLQNPWYYLNNTNEGYKHWPTTAAYALLCGGMHYGEAAAALVGPEAMSKIKPIPELMQARKADGSYSWLKESTQPFFEVHGVRLYKDDCPSKAAFNTLSKTQQEELLDQRSVLVCIECGLYRFGGDNSKAMEEELEELEQYPDSMGCCAQFHDKGMQAPCIWMPKWRIESEKAEADEEEVEATQPYVPPSSSNSGEGYTY